MHNPQKYLIKLMPMNKTLEYYEGESLQDILFVEGVEFPCGGRGKCKGCRVKVTEGNIPATDIEAQTLSPKELEEGWRLSCKVKISDDVTLELAQWEAKILTDDTQFAFISKKGLGIAVDLGTTTLVAQLLDLQTGNVLAVKSALNPQARHGADLISRIDFSVTQGKQKILQELIHKEIGILIVEVLNDAKQDADNLVETVIVGNTVMHNLFCGIDLTPMSVYPFEPINDSLVVMTAEELGWTFASQSKVLFLPCLGTFVGSDILAGVLATEIYLKDKINVLIDLGTNGEMVAGNKDRMICASTAAGPAFEGARISMGMRASTGAVSEVTVENGKLNPRVIGTGAARGICGSGLVDVAAGALELGLMNYRGKIQSGDEMPLVDNVVVTQTDIRELQLAKGAIAAGVKILLAQLGKTYDDVDKLYLAGAFGNYINRSSAERIGLIHFPPEQVTPAGNTALLGAKRALFRPENEDGSYAMLRKKIEHLTLSSVPEFQDIYVDEMFFPQED